MFLTSRPHFTQKNRLKRLSPSHYLLKVKLYFPSSTHHMTSATWFSPVSYLLLVSSESDTSVTGHAGSVEKYLLGLQTAATPPLYIQNNSVLPL